MTATAYQPVQLACVAMGTRFELVVFHPDERHARAAGEEALGIIREWHDQLSLFAPASEVSRLNREATSRPVRVDAGVFALLRFCRDVWHASGGAFDPTIGPLMRAAGFRDAPRDEAAIADAITRVGMENVILDDGTGTVRFARDGVSLDLGAVGKGWAIDDAAQMLHDGGIDSFFLQGGTSSMIARNGASHAAPFRVALSRERDAPVIELHNAALGVSAPRGRMVDGKGHVIDPRTGRSAAHRRTAAVVAPTAAGADAWSTALLVAGDAAAVPPSMTAYCETMDRSLPRWTIRPAQETR